MIFSTTQSALAKGDELASPVMFSTGMFNPNPFKIVYFHKEEGPYEMEFTEQGKFNKDFGPGFYDEAGSLTLKMIKELRKNQAQ